MKQIILTFGGILGTLAVVFGAFGAHAFKKILTSEQLQSFETGVRYQFYHSFLLIILGLSFPFLETTQVVMGWCIITGTLLFSFSIYGLCLSAAYGAKQRWLGPVTPLGGLLLVIGWILVTYHLVNYTVYL